jgi:cytochrome b561
LTFVVLFGIAWLGLYMNELPKGPESEAIYALHRAFGITLLLLVLLRLVWRWTNPTPAPPEGVRLGDWRLVRLVHGAFYAVMLAMPVIGWIGSSAAGATVLWFGNLELPALAGRDEGLKEAMTLTHRLPFYVLFGLLVLHVAGVLKHRFRDRIDVLARMLPARGPRTSGADSQS